MEDLEIKILNLENKKLTAEIKNLSMEQKKLETEEKKMQTEVDFMELKNILSSSHFQKACKQRVKQDHFYLHSRSRI